MKQFAALQRNSMYRLAVMFMLVATVVMVGGAELWVDSCEDHCDDNCESCCDCIHCLNT
ncbi:hypothetical protein GF377_04090, partial [candidate division GN15 bacterium]|nr:hypothetical protein [candidate division GN15 bacterium]